MNTSINLDVVKCTIFENLFSKKPYYITIEQALARIKSGVSKEKIEKIRNEIDKERRSEQKKCFHLFVLVAYLKKGKTIK